MKKILLTLVVFLIGVFAYAQEIHTGVSYESITIINNAVGITPATLTLVTTNGLCSGRLEDAQIRFRVDGIDPTALEGILLDEGGVITIKGLGNLTRIRMIKSTPADPASAVLKLQCYQ